MTELDQVEYSRLAEDIQRIEKALATGNKPDSEFLLKGYLLNAKNRLSEIRVENVRGEDSKREEKTREIAAVAHLVEAETRLNTEEKEQYSEFLAKDFFTKSDFSKLEKFYDQTWDRLSEGGKAEMSHRVWEGVRHNEYTFDELPETVRKKEAERLYGQFTGQSPADKSLENIPPQDRADFVREHEAGNEKAATQVMCRESFSKNVSTHSSKVVSQRDTTVTAAQNAEENAVRPVDLQVKSASGVQGMASTFEDDAPGIKPTDLQPSGDAQRVR